MRPSASLLKLDAALAVPHLIEAARDPRADRRALACRYLVEACTEQGGRRAHPGSALRATSMKRCATKPHARSGAYSNRVYY